MTGTGQAPAQATASRPGLGRLLGSTAVAITGQGILATASPLLAASLTRNPLAISAVAAAGYAAWLFVGLLAGALVDRWPRRRVMVTTDLVRAGLLAVLALLVLVERAHVAALVGCMFLVGVGNCFFDPAAQAAIPAVVGRDKGRLSRANGKLWAIDTFGRSLVGPPLGSVLFAAAAVAPFAVDAAAFLVSAIVLSGLSSIDRTAPAERPPRIVPAVRDSLRFLVRHAELRGLTLAMAAYNLAYNVGFVTLVLLAQDRLGLGDVGFGLLVAAMAVGGVAGGWVAPRLSSRLSPFAVYALALVAQAVGWAVVVLSPSPWPAGAALALVGLASTTVSVIGGSARQLLTPDDMLGRVVSVTRLLGIGSAAVGSLIGGAVASGAGASAPFVAALLLALVFAALFAARSRRT